LVIENRKLGASEIMCAVEAEYRDFSKNNSMQLDVILFIIKQS